MNKYSKILKLSKECLQVIHKGIRHKCGNKSGNLEKLVRNNLSEKGQMQIASLIMVIPRKKNNFELNLNT